MRDFTDDLAAVENALRHVIDRVGRDKFGPDYLDQLRVPPKTIQNWTKSQEKEMLNRGAGVPENRILYYSNFSDLQNIILRNWSSFEDVFIDEKQTEVFLSKLRKLRNPDAHRRKLTETEKALITGMAGELRTQITRYLAEKDTPDEYFPRMELLVDSLGNLMNSQVSPPRRPVLRVGSIVEFTAEAWDPFGQTLEYRWEVNPPHSDTFQDWSSENHFVWHVQPNQIANPASVNLEMRSSRSPHAIGHRDASWSMYYTVIPVDLPNA